MYESYLSDTLFLYREKEKKSVRMIRIEEKKVCFNRGVNMINSENSMGARSLFFSFFRLLFNISKALNLIFLFVSKKSNIFIFFRIEKKFFGCKLLVSKI